jgi:RNA polymerase-binding transcription factor DksA
MAGYPRRGGVAQLAERPPFKRMREGSSPSTPTPPPTPAGRRGCVPCTPVDDDAVRRHLTDERLHLEQVRATVEREHLDDEPEEDASAALSHAAQHPADAASDAFEREKEFAILDRVEADLTAVDRALERLTEGTYGTCEACGERIADERLVALPAARFCLQHQADLET